MEDAQSNKPHDLQRIQFSLLRSTVKHAFLHVPYYARLFAKLGIFPDEIRDFHDFAKIPISTKSGIRQAYPREIYVRNSWLDTKTRTSGSTAEPLEVVIDGKSHAWHLAGRYLFDSWMGIIPGERWLRITGHSQLAKRLRARILRGEVLVPPEWTAKARFNALVDEIDKQKPSGLSGAASYLALLCQHIQESDVKLTHKPKGIFSTSETLLPDQRRLICSVFEVEPFDRYGLGELGGYVAQDCGCHGGLHINPFLVHAEVVRNDQVAEPGETGRLILTDLQNRAMPLIRYDTGDLASLEPECQCGRAFPMLGKLIGRQSDYVCTKLGAFPLVTLTDRFVHAFAQYVHFFQFIQDQNNKTMLKIVPTTRYDEGSAQRILRFLENYFEDFEVHLVPEIEPEPSGKTLSFKRTHSVGDLRGVC